MNEPEKKLNQNIYMFLLGPEKWRIITPVWFNWLRWFLALGAIGYLAGKTNNIGLQVIYGISYIAFYMFITVTISDIMNFKLIRNQLFNKIVTLCMALVVLAATQFVLNQGIKDLLKGQ